MDLENFNKSISALNINRTPIVGKLPDFIFSYLEKNLKWTKYNPQIIRTYLYTGEYGDNLQKKLKRQHVNETDIEKKAIIERKIIHVTKRQVRQRQSFDELLQYDFIELRTKPLQYSPSDLSIFQKGVDVQISVDLLTHGYSNNYDVAILCTGDVDLLESVKYVKNWGKKVILLSHPKLMSYELGKISDHFIDLTKLDHEQIDTFSVLNQQAHH